MQGRAEPEMDLPQRSESVKRELEDHVVREPRLRSVAWSTREGATSARSGSASLNERQGFVKVGGEDWTAQRLPIPRAGHRLLVAGMLRSLAAAPIRRALVALALLTAVVTQAAVANTPVLELTAGCGLGSLTETYNDPKVGDIFKVTLTRANFCQPFVQGYVEARYDGQFFEGYTIASTLPLTGRSPAFWKTEDRPNDTEASFTFTLTEVPTEPKPFNLQVGHQNVFVQITLTIPPRPPSTPSIALVAGPGRGEVTATVTDDAAGGGGASTGFAVSLSDGKSCTISGSDVAGTPKSGSCTISGLGDGVSVTANAVASNVAGSSSATSASNAVTTFAVPGSPTGLSVGDVVVSASDLALDGVVTVSWSVPTSNGGTSITDYVVTVSPIDGGVPVVCVAVTATSCSFSAVVGTLGKSYSVSVVAENLVGSSAPSTPVVTSFRRVPYAPTISGVAVTSSANDVSVSFTAGSDGGTSVTNFEYSTDGGATFAALSPAQTASPLTFPLASLTSNTAYDLVIRAVNVEGAGAASGTTSFLTRPGSPTNVVASLAFGAHPQGVSTSDGSFVVSWSAPVGGSDGVLAYEVYRVVNGSRVGAAVCSVSPTDCALDVVGVSLTDTYVFEVVASNASGLGPVSARSEGYLAIARTDVPSGVAASLTSVVGDVLVSWVAPVVVNASPVSAYFVAAVSRGGGVDGGCSLLAVSFSDGLSCVVEGLSVEEPWDNSGVGGPNPASTLDATYDFFVYAINGAGWSLGQSVSDAVNPPASLVVQGTPNPPVLVDLFGDDRSLFVAFREGVARGLPEVRFEFEVRDSSGVSVVVPWVSLTDAGGGLVVPSGSDVGVALAPRFDSFPGSPASLLTNGSEYRLFLRAVNSVELVSEVVDAGVFTPRLVPSAPVGVGVTSPAPLSVVVGRHVLVSWAPPVRYGDQELVYRVLVFRADSLSPSDPFDVEREVVASCDVLSPITRCLLTGTESSPTDFAPGEYDVVVAAALASGVPLEFGRAIESVRVSIPAVGDLPAAPGVPVFGYVPGVFERATTTWSPVVGEATGGSEVLYYERALHSAGNEVVALSSCFVNVSGVGNSPEEISFAGDALGDGRLSCDVVNLPRGWSFTARARARTVAGWGPWSAFSPVFTASVLPGAPELLEVVAGSTWGDLSFRAPADDGGAAVQAYEFSLDAGESWRSFDPVVWRDDAPVLLSGLVNGVTYSVVLRARNPVGVGPVSNSLSFTPRADDVGVPLRFRVIPGDARGWLLFEFSESASAVEVSLDDGAWLRTDLNVLEVPYLLADLTNNQAYCVRTREVGPTGPGAASAAVCFTPSGEAAAAPDLDLVVEAPDRAIEVIEVDGMGELTFDFVLSNTGEIDFENVWLKPFGIPTGAELISIVPVGERGTITQYPVSWYWEGVNLLVGGKATIRITIRLELGQ
jgi:large repetitive protein